MVIGSSMIGGLSPEVKRLTTSRPAVQFRCDRLLPAPISAANRDIVLWSPLNGGRARTESVQVPLLRNDTAVRKSGADHAEPNYQCLRAWHIHERPTRRLSR